MKYLINFTYDGSAFYGSQRQNNKRTVLGEIDKCLSKIYNSDIHCVASSRTDTKVHAINQYAVYEVCREIDNISYRLNRLLPSDIYVKSIKCVKDDFHVRYNVIKKEYIYKINVGEYNPFERDYVFQYNKKINIKLINKAKKYLVGTHNFKAFTSDNEKENYVRHIYYIKINQIKNYVYIYICADGFLRYMIRNIVGLFIDINEGKANVNNISHILNSMDRRENGQCISGVGLYLNKVWFK